MSRANGSLVDASIMMIPVGIVAKHAVQKDEELLSASNFQFNVLYLDGYCDRPNIHRTLVQQDQIKGNKMTGSGDMLTLRFRAGPTVSKEKDWESNTLSI